MRHAVTGGAGFIGSHITEALISRGDRVLVLDDLSTGRPENLSHLGTRLELRKVDLATERRIGDHLRGIDTVFHQAAIPSVPDSLEDPVRTHAANVNGTLNLLTACREAGVRRVVYASSCALYGDDLELPKREDMPASPLSPYGAQKYFGEVYMQVFWRTWGLETVSLRYFNVFGPRQDAGSPYSGVIARFVPALLSGSRPTVYGDGRQSRDFVYVADVVDANLKAANARGVGGEVFNIAGGQRIPVNQLLDEIRRITHSQIEAEYAPPRPGDILHSLADIDLARQRLDWIPTTDFSLGLERTIEWYRSADDARI